MGRFFSVSFGLLVVFLSMSGTAAVDPCPPDWSSNGVYCYMLFTEPKSWKDAEEFCKKQGKGGHLLSILDKKEKILVDIVLSANLNKSRYKIWTGLSERQHCSSHWSDGFFRSYEIPILYSECFVLQKETKTTLIATPCEESLPFMCKYPVPGKGPAV